VCDVDLRSVLSPLPPPPSPTAAMHTAPPRCLFPGPPPCLCVRCGVHAQLAHPAQHRGQRERIQVAVRQPTGPHRAHRAVHAQAGAGHPPGPPPALHLYVRGCWHPTHPSIKSMLPLRALAGRVARVPHTTRPLPLDPPRMAACCAPPLSLCAQPPAVRVCVRWAAGIVLPASHVHMYAPPSTHTRSHSKPFTVLSSPPPPLHPAPPPTQ
jgi:hypothetical protein